MKGGIIKQLMAAHITVEERALLVELQQSVDPLGMLREKSQASAIEFLFYRNFLTAAKYLSDERRFVFNVNEAHGNGECLVHFVAKYADCGWLQWLITLPNAQLFLRTSANENLYHRSAHATSAPFLDVLFSLPHNSEHAFGTNILGQTPFEIAIKYDNPVFLQYYFTKFRALMMAYRNNKNQNVLHLLAQHNAVNCYNTLKILLSPAELADLLARRDQASCTPLHIAYQMAQEGKLELFHAMKGYVENKVGTLQWQAALQAVISRFSEISVTTESAESAFDVPPLEEVLGHAHQSFQAMAAEKAYSQTFCDQVEEEYPNLRARFK